MIRKPGKLMMKSAEYSIIKILDPKQGNSHPKSVLSTIFCLSGQIWSSQCFTLDQKLTTLSAPINELSFVHGVLGKCI